MAKNVSTAHTTLFPPLPCYPFFFFELQRRFFFPLVHPCLFPHATPVLPSPPLPSHRAAPLSRVLSLVFSPGSPRILSPMFSPGSPTRSSPIPPWFTHASSPMPHRFSPPLPLGCPLFPPLPCYPFIFFELQRRFFFPPVHSCLFHHATPVLPSPPLPSHRAASLSRVLSLVFSSGSPRALPPAFYPPCSLRAPQRILPPSTPWFARASSPMPHRFSPPLPLGCPPFPRSVPRVLSRLPPSRLFPPSFCPLCSLRAPPRVLPPSPYRLSPPLGCLRPPPQPRGLPHVLSLVFSPSSPLPPAFCPRVLSGLPPRVLPPSPYRLSLPPGCPRPPLALFYWGTGCWRGGGVVLPGEQNAGGGGAILPGEQMGGAVLPGEQKAAGAEGEGHAKCRANPRVEDVSSPGSEIADGGTGAARGGRGDVSSPWAERADGRREQGEGGKKTRWQQGKGPFLNIAMSSATYYKFKRITNSNGVFT